MTKRCPDCGEIKDASQFNRDRKNNPPLFSYCRPCNAARQKAYRASRPTVKQVTDPDASRRRRYGLTPERYLGMREAQGDACAICKRARSLVVDHCHTTGQVRGLLCHHCNTMLGQADDNPELLLAAIRYLQHATAR